MTQLKNAVRIYTIYALAIVAFLIASSAFSSAQQLIWQGHTWAVTKGGMAGVVPADPRNVFIDGKGYLHLNITNTSGTWTGAQLFTVDNLPFGTFQWVIEGDVWNMDPVIVLGLFPYGPENGIGKDGTNEIDIEFSQWANTCGCNADFTIYPALFHQYRSSYNRDFTVKNGKNLTTARMEWSSTSVVFTLMSGVQPIGTRANVLQTATYKSSNATNIPQHPLPVGMNLWAYTTLPSTPQAVIIRSFEYRP